nr:MAG TPA: hypothetical protein [Caudoviricetes sp.]
MSWPPLTIYRLPGPLFCWSIGLLAFDNMPQKQKWPPFVHLICIIHYYQP